MGFRDSWWSDSGLISREVLERAVIEHSQEAIGKAILAGVMVRVQLGPDSGYGPIGEGFRYGILNGMNREGIFTGKDLYGNDILYDFRGEKPVVSWAKGSKWGGPHV